MILVIAGCLACIGICLILVCYRVFRRPKDVKIMDYNRNSNEEIDLGTCKICRKENEFVANKLLPCGHMGYCNECVIK